LFFELLVARHYYATRRFPAREREVDLPTRNPVRRDSVLEERFLPGEERRAAPVFLLALVIFTFLFVFLVATRPKIGRVKLLIPSGFVV